MEEDSAVVFLDPIDLECDDDGAKRYEEIKVIVACCFDNLVWEDPPRGTMTEGESNQRRLQKRQLPSYKTKERDGRERRKVSACMRIVSGVSESLSTCTPQKKHETLRNVWFNLECEMIARACQELLYNTRIDDGRRGVIISFLMESDEVLAICRKLWPKGLYEKLNSIPPWKHCVNPRLQALLERNSL
jgi:hypothetical protein